jgi:hypothetical protein
LSASCTARRLHWRKIVQKILLEAGKTKALKTPTLFEVVKNDPQVCSLKSNIIYELERKLTEILLIYEQSKLNLRTLFFEIK